MSGLYFYLSKSWFLQVLQKLLLNLPSLLNKVGDLYVIHDLVNSTFIIQTKLIRAQEKEDC